MSAPVCPECRVALTADGCPSCGWQPGEEITRRVAVDEEPWQPQIPITTGNELPGADIAAILGPVFAMTVRSRNIVSQTGAKVKSVVGGELRAMTRMLEQAQLDAIKGLEERALALGADAIIGMRFDIAELGGMWTSVCAYGTAVSVQTVGATDNSASMG